LGKINVQSIVKKEESVLTAMTKRIGLKMRFYEFRQRLENKCKQKGVLYKLVDEKYTTKMCSNCGGYDKEIGGAKIYDCEKCQNKMDRDGQSSRGILIKGI
jgi:transposase